jgi:2-dehydropantoate 2-reductase
VKICIFGAGAVGGNMAALLAAGGAEVSVVARGPHLAAMRDHGISLTWKGETIHADVRASDDPATLGKQDAVIVTLKAPSLAGAAPGIATLLGPETPVVFAVNGIPWWYRPRTGLTLTMLDPDGAMERHIGRARALAGVLFMSCTVTTPGHIDMAGTTNGLVLGEIEGGASARLAAIAAPLRAGGLWVDEAADIRPALWRKLGLNLASGPLAVLGGAALPALYTEETVAEAAAALLAETTAIAAAEGVEAATDPTLYLANARTLPHKPSILQDYEAGRPMKIAALLDAPLEIARRHGVATPVLGLIAGLVRVRAREAGLL